MISGRLHAWRSTNDAKSIGKSAPTAAAGCIMRTQRQTTIRSSERFMKRVLLLLPTTGYRNDDFLAAAKALEVEIVPAANYCHQLAPQWGFPPIMALELDRPEK